VQRLLKVEGQEVPHGKERSTNEDHDRIGARLLQSGLGAGGVSDVAVDDDGD
jgi:hypothetical protein